MYLFYHITPNKEKTPSILQERGFLPIDQLIIRQLAERDQFYFFFFFFFGMDGSPPFCSDP